MEKRKIAVLTSGGDAPGMNAAIRASVRLGIYYGFEMYGVERGYQGLIDDDIFQMTTRSVSNIVQCGGTMLKTARCAEFRELDGIGKAVANLKKRGISDVIAIGGDGTFRGGKDMCENFDINVIGIPGTIDNDLAYTDFTLGFDTAVNTVLSAINNLRDTMTAHDRCSMLEVMGRHCGDIALYSGISGGAEHILVPEMPFDLDKIAESINSARERGKTSNMIIFAEGAGDKDDICKYLTDRTGVKITVTTLGHVQRGGAPTMQDRVLAAQFSERAIKLIMSNVKNRVVGVNDGKIIDMDIAEALAVPRKINEDLYKLAEILDL